MAKSVQIWPHWFYTKLIPFLEGPGRCFLPLRFGPREGLECCQERMLQQLLWEGVSTLSGVWKSDGTFKKGPQKTSRILKKKKKEKASLYKRINEKGTLERFLRIRHQNGDSNLWKSVASEESSWELSQHSSFHINGLYIPTFAFRIGARWRTNFWTFREKTSQTNLHILHKSTATYKFPPNFPHSWYLMWLLGSAKSTCFMKGKVCRAISIKK